MDHTVIRDQIAYYVGNAFTITPVGRAQLLRTAYNSNAPHEVITELLALPEQFYKGLDDVYDWLPRLPARPDGREVT